MKTKTINILATKTQRVTLPVRRDPYFITLRSGCSLGFRRGPDTWIARYLDGSKTYQFKALDSCEDYDDAVKAAEGWFGQMSGTGHRSVTRGTIADALRAYLQHLRDLGRHDAAATAQNKLQTCVLGNPEPKRGKPVAAAALADVQLEHAAKEDFISWRRALSKGRANQTTNRYVGCVVAALNTAVGECGYIGNAAAWSLKDLEEADANGDTAVYLTTAQLKRMTQFLSRCLQSFVNVLDATGGRPLEVANATVEDYDAKHHTLVLRWKKGRPVKVRARVVHLDPASKPLFKSLIKDKLPRAPLCPNEDGGHFRNHQWGREIAAAIRSANLAAKKSDGLIPVEASAYSIRHKRISELLQVHCVDPMTVAKQTGTSMTMMEKYYWKFLPSAMQDKWKAAKA